MEIFIQDGPIACGSHFIQKLQSQPPALNRYVHRYADSLFLQPVRAMEYFFLDRDEAIKNIFDDVDYSAYAKAKEQRFRGSHLNDKNLVGTQVIASDCRGRRNSKP
jgi:hypothetical protein